MTVERMATGEMLNEITTITRIWTRFNRTKFLSYAFLHFLFFLYSFVGVCFKRISETKSLSFIFFVYFGIAFFILFIYALLWQQALKRIPLTTAFANKGIVVMWGMLWGFLIFQERITASMLIGAVFICTGIVLVTRDG